MKHWKEIPYTRIAAERNTEIAEGAYVLRFERTFRFEAGQVIALGIAPEIAPRLYSIASGEHAPYIEVLYTEKSEGELTPKLSGIRPGELVMVSNPFGTFTHVSDSAVYVAAGTGIAPFVSRIRSGKGDNPTLIHGVSDPEYFYFGDELRDALGDQYLQCCSRCRDEAFFHGRVTHFLEQWKGLDTRKKYYLCGSAEMVVDTRDVLIARGVPFASIDAEIFF
jgi:ferredoxin/flavodoxin---NADP+ reductase